MDGAYTSAPVKSGNCTTVGSSWVFSLNSTVGKAQYAMLLSAYMNGETVNVVGKGTCNPTHGREEPLYINLDNEML